jgi:outer membrane protein TolC
MLKSLPASLILLLIACGISHAGQLTLSEALKRAAGTNNTLKIVKIDEQIAGDDVKASRSGYLPRVDAQAGYTAQQVPQSIATPFGAFQTQEPDYGFFSLGISQTLYDFGRTDARYARALANREATRMNYQGQEQNLFLKTVTSYFRILQSEKLLKAAEDEVAQMTDHLRMAKVLYEEGVVTRNNVLQAEVQLSRSKQHGLEVANQLDNAWLTLNDGMGTPPGYRAALSEDTQMGLPDLEEPAQEAIVGRAEIHAQQKLLDASEQEVKETRTGYYPEFYARAGLDYVQNDKVKEQVIMAATVGFRVNLFDGYATTARFNQSVKNRSHADVRLNQLLTDFALEYRTAVNDAKVAKQRISATETSIKQGEENLRINKDRYQEQVGTATDVIDAQTLLTQVRTDYYQAIFDYEVALARVKRGRGEL